MSENNWGYQSGFNYQEAFNNRLTGSIKPDSSSSEQSSETWVKQFENQEFRGKSEAEKVFDYEALRDFMGAKVGGISSQTLAEWIRKIGGVNAITTDPVNNTKVAQGGAKFTEGSIYSGVRGLSVSEVAGASYTNALGFYYHGTYGDKHTFSTGDVARSEAYSKIENSNIRKCEGTINSITESTGGSVVNQTKAARTLVNHNSVGGSLTTANTVGAFYQTINASACGSLAVNVVTDGIAVALNVVMGLTYSIQASVNSLASNNAARNITIYNKAGGELYTHNVANVKRTIDKVNLSSITCTGDSLTTSNNNVETFKTNFKKVRSDSLNTEEMFIDGKLSVGRINTLLDDYLNHTLNAKNQKNDAENYEFSGKTYLTKGEVRLTKYGREVHNSTHLLHI